MSTSYDLTRARWRKSTRSGTSGNCVEIAGNLAGIVPIRDSKDPHGPALTVTPSSWTMFLSQLRAGALDQ